MGRIFHWCVSHLIFCFGASLSFQATAIPIHPLILSYQPLKVMVTASDLQTMLNTELQKNIPPEVEEKNFIYQHKGHEVFVKEGKFLIKMKGKAIAEGPLNTSISSGVRILSEVRFTTEQWKFKAQSDSVEVVFANTLIKFIAYPFKSYIESTLKKAVNDSLKDLEEIGNESELSDMMKEIKIQSDLVSRLKADGLYLEITKKRERS